MIRKPNTPPGGVVIREGMRIREIHGGYWMHNGKRLPSIPPGALARVVLWNRPADGNYGPDYRNAGCAFLYDGIRHPEFNAFPMARYDINWDVLPEGIEEVT